MAKPSRVSSPDEARHRLCALGDHLRATLLATVPAVRTAGGPELARVEGETAADTVYGLDRIADDALLGWFELHWPGVEVVSEGLAAPVVVGTDPEWTVIVDTVDGTRGLMYDKRPAWSLAAAAPRGGTLRDVVAAAMTELPVLKQGAADQLSATRGSGVRAERVDLRDGTRSTFAPRPSTAEDLEHGFAQVVKFFPPGKPALAALEAQLFDRLGARHVFDDEYLCSGGQLHELMTGRDRFVADLRPLVAPGTFACHPYDVCTAMLLEEAGGVVTDPWGAPLDAPLDTTTPVAWAGYANIGLARRIGPILADLVDDLHRPPATHPATDPPEQTTHPEAR
jgi:fructose-1,6-bisphosphatase/inositol monophosphatase family enzyme